MSSDVSKIASFLMVVVFLMLLPAGEVLGEETEPWSVFAYGGKLSDNRIGQILQLQTEFTPSYVWSVGLSRRVYKIVDDLALEVEANVARHTGLQSHWELNAAAMLRWHRFPWDRYVDSTLAYGVGPSFAFRRPPVERRSSRTPAHLLVFMPVEITFSGPKKRRSPWEVLIRVHHRSGAYGVVSDAGGSNFIAAGIRYRF